MKRLPQIMIFFAFLFFIAFGIVTFMNCSFAHSSEPFTKEKEGSASKNEDYWTPERLKEAKPLELPHPTSPDLKPPVPPHKSVPSQPPSYEAPGHEGEEGIPPDGTNLLFEGGQISKSSLTSPLAGN